MIYWRFMTNYETICITMVSSHNYYLTSVIKIFLITDLTSITRKHFWQIVPNTEKFKHTGDSNKTCGSKHEVLVTMNPDTKGPVI